MHVDEEMSVRKRKFKSEGEDDSVLAKRNKRDQIQSKCENDSDNDETAKEKENDSENEDDCNIYQSAQKIEILDDSEKDINDSIQHEVSALNDLEHEMDKFIKSLTFLTIKR